MRAALARSTLCMVLLTGPVAAQSVDPSEPCGDVLGGAEEVEKLMIAAWAVGHLEAAGAEPRPMDVNSAGEILTAIFERCRADASRSLADVLQAEIAARGVTPEAQPAAVSVTEASPQPPFDEIEPGDPGSEEDATALLERFMEPDADRAALTAELIPGESDIRAVYKGTVADRLIDLYGQLFVPGIAIGPRPDQERMLVTYTSTGALKAGEPVLDDFPGGYVQAAPHFLVDVPIVRFSFVPADRDLGLAFDGLIFVNGHWVLMPKPWRVLD